VYQPDQHALVATADLGRVVSRVGGGLELVVAVCRPMPCSWRLY
jgi:hypothetical protein